MVEDQKMAVVIQFRHGLAALWTQTNPILADGEIGVETDTELFKVGNGVTHWNEKTYANRGLPGAKGDKGDTGAASTVPGPQGDKGDPGDAGGDSVVPGPQGIQGVAGIDGKTILADAGIPQNSIGVDGDFYINLTNSSIYGPKVAGIWGVGTSLIGSQGPKGDTGDKGDQGDQGIAGFTVLNGNGAPGVGLGVNGDFYIDTQNTAIYGPKTGGAWGAATNLIGSTGADSVVPGPQGEQGIQGPTGPGNLAYQGAWVTVTLYHPNDILKAADGLFYRCKTEHTSGSTTEPGVGASWADDWELFGGGGGTVPIGLLQGLVLSKKDTDEVYVDAGSIEVNGLPYNSDQRLSIAPSYDGATEVNLEWIAGSDVANWRMNDANNYSGGLDCLFGYRQIYINYYSEGWLACPAFADSGLLIPQGATIASAVLSVKGNNANGATNAIIKAYDLDAPEAGWLTQPSDAITTPRTTASVSQQITLSGAYTDIDVTSIVQEIVNRPGWVSGNHIVFSFSDTETTELARVNSIQGTDSINLAVSFMPGASTLEVDTDYYVYVAPPAVGTGLAAEDLSLSTSVCVYDENRGGYYHPVSTERRCIGWFTTDGSGIVPETFYGPGEAADTTVISNDIRHIVKLTQAAYDLLALPDTGTLYIIVEA